MTKKQRVVRIKLEPEYKSVQKVSSMNDLLEESSSTGESVSDNPFSLDNSLTNTQWTSVTPNLSAILPHVVFLQVYLIMRSVPTQLLIQGRLMNEISVLKVFAAEHSTLVKSARMYTVLLRLCVCLRVRRSQVVFSL